jgi:hypothetical protein
MTSIKCKIHLKVREYQDEKTFCDIHLLAKVLLLSEICETLTADLIVVTDNSGSVGSVNYDLEKQFVVDLFNELTIAQDDVRVGVIDYSTNVNSQTFGFYDPLYDTNIEVINKVNSFRYVCHLIIHLTLLGSFCLMIL